MAATLPLDLALKDGDFRIVIPVLLTIFFFMIYWFISESGAVRKFFYGRSEHDTAAVSHFLFAKILGFIALGLIPLIIFLLLLPAYSMADLGLGFNAGSISFTVVSALVLVVLAGISARFTALKARKFGQFPQIRARVWTRSTVAVNIAGWALYLIGYELLFRGILLVPLADRLGIWPAIAVNIALYSAAHIPQGYREAFGAAPIGLIFCLVTLASGTVWVAIIVHLTMSLTNSFTTMKMNPEIIYRKR